MNMRSFLLPAGMAVAAFALVPAGTAGPLQSDSLAKREASCTAGDTQECQLLGSAYELGLYAPKDLAKARSAYERGCKPDDWTTGTSCMHLYKMASLGEGGPRDPAKARMLEPKVCNSKIISQEVYLESFGLCKK
ncbi:MAG TPA: hypothetical protein VM662_04740 [Sphingomonas sp.]|nr:hypothetical protein [Sphingomonas sp.]